MDLNYKPAIVVPAFKRENDLKRLLDLVNQSWFPDRNIELIISIDGGASKGVMETAQSFQFESGNVEIIKRDLNFGVKEHIIKCADLSEKYESVIILEDDLIVSPAFYDYALKALSYYDEESNIAGVSLYSQRYNETAALPFEPLESECSVYFMQLGSSWGQAWTWKQWAKFKKWNEYEKIDPKDIGEQIPDNVQKWPETSWKKLFNQYLVENNRYIVYPYSSFTTNNGGKDGTHMQSVENRFQVPLKANSRLGKGFNFADYRDDRIKYDSFMESESSIVAEWAGFRNNQIEMDLYGTKPVELLKRKPYAITSKSVKHQLVLYPLTFRPLELNIRYPTEGLSKAYFSLIKTDSLSGNEKISDSNYFRIFEYFIYGTLKTKKFARIYFIAMLKLIPKRIRALMTDTH